MGSYFVGSAVVLSATFTTPTKALVDPTSVRLRVKDPTGVEVDYNSPTYVSAGIYTQQIVPTLTGTWSYRWEGTGAVVVTLEAKFEVKPTAFT